MAYMAGRPIMFRALQVQGDWRPSFGNMGRHVQLHSSLCTNDFVTNDIASIGNAAVGPTNKGMLPLSRRLPVLKQQLLVVRASRQRNIHRNVASSSQYPVRPRPARSGRPSDFPGQDWVHLLSHLPLIIKVFGSTMPSESAAEAVTPGSRTDAAAITSLEAEMPALDSRWVHTGAKYLQLLPTPITVAETEYKAFSDLENQRIEAAWEALPQDRREEIISNWGREDGEGGEKPGQTLKTKSPRQSTAPSPGPDDVGDVPSDPEVTEGDAEDLRPKKSEQYRAIIERNYQDPDKLDVVEGVAVSQVSNL